MCTFMTVRIWYINKTCYCRVTLWRIFSFEKLYRCLIFPLYLWFGHVTMATTGASPCHGLTTCYTVSQAMFTISKTADDPRILPLLYPHLTARPYRSYARVNKGWRSIVWKVSVLAESWTWRCFIVPVWLVALHTSRNAISAVQNYHIAG